MFVDFKVENSYCGILFTLFNIDMTVLHKYEMVERCRRLSTLKPLVSPTPVRTLAAIKTRVNFHSWYNLIVFVSKYCINSSFQREETTSLPIAIGPQLICTAFYASNLLLLFSVHKEERDKKTFQLHLTTTNFSIPLKFIPMTKRDGRSPCSWRRPTV